MIQLNKKDLGFLQVYKKWAKNGQHLQIHKINGSIQFILNNEQGVIFTEIKGNGDIEDFYNFEVVPFVDLIESFNDLDVISVNKEGIRVGKSSYDIPNENVNKENVSSFLDIIEKQQNNALILKDIKKIKYIQHSIGSSENKLNTIAYQNGYYVSSDRTNMTSLVKTGHNGKNFYFSSDFLLLVNQLNMDEIEIYDLEDFYYSKINDTYFFIMKQDYILPYLFSEEVKASYTFPYSFEIQKELLKTILYRMKIISQGNPVPRVSIELLPNSIEIKNEGGREAKETIVGTVPEKLKGSRVIVDLLSLSTSLNVLQGELINFSINNYGEEQNVIVVKDETNDNFYIICLSQ